MNKVAPEFITHYNRSEPFRSVTQSPPEDWPKIVQKLSEKTSWGIQRFSDPEYLIRRAKVERDLRKEFIKTGGKPELDSPIYFFLGRNSGFEEKPENKGYSIYLKSLATETITFSYGDSMFAFDEDYRRQCGPAYQNQLCTRIWRLEDLGVLLNHKDYPTQPLSIEAQLWVKPNPDNVRALEI